MIHRLRDNPAVESDAALEAEIEAKLAHVEKAAEPFRKHRNKIIAHLDLRTALSVAVDPLPGITPEMVQEALDALADTFNTLDAKTRGSTTFFADAIQHGGANSLVRRLDEAERWREHRRRS